jgi:long-chain fatty acid transport protein
MKHRVLVAAISAAVVTPTAMASGYKLNEQGAAGAGNAYAGRAAVVEDASVVFYNPAGMVKLERPELTVGASYINASGSFDFDSYTNGAGKKYSSLEGSPYSDGGDFLSAATIPYAYFAMPINDKFAAGFGIFVPFGTNTDYENDFVGGGFADQTKLTSIEFQPAVAYRINDQLSLGFGLDVAYMKGLISKQVDAVPYNEQLKFLNGGKNPAHAALGFAELTDEQWAGSVGFDNHYEVEGDDWAFGYNLSMMWDLNSDITLGVSYRSQMEFELRGDSKFETKSGVVGLTKAPSDIPGTSVSAGDYIIAPVDGATGSVPDQASKVPLTTPQSLTVSYAHQLTNELQLVAGATWTQWSVFKDFDIISTESETGVIESLSGLGQDNGYIGHIEENWNDTTAIAIGANYQLNDDWLLRAGYANDQSPVTNTYRTARVPDNDRQWLSTGVNYRIDQDLDVDFAFSYLFFEDTQVNEFDRDLAGNKKGATNLQGDYSMDAMAFSLQVNYKL